MQAKPGTIILLKAQVGSGKTTFCINDLWKHCKTNKKKLLLLVNRSALRGQLRQSILKSIGLKGNANMEERGILEFEGLTVTTYQYLQNVFGEVYELGRRKIGALAAENFDYVVADEIHYLFCDSIFSVETGRLRQIPRVFRKAVRVYMSATLEPVRDVIFEMEKIQDLYDECETELSRAYLQFRYNDISLERRTCTGMRLNKKEVLEMAATKTDYSYLTPVFYEEQSDIAELIVKQSGEGDKGKWLVFIDTKEEGRQKKAILNSHGISAAFVAANGMQSDDEQEYERLLKFGKFETQVLLATSVIDNGVSIVDDTVTHIVLSGFEMIQAVQQAGRIRFKGKRPPIELYICRHTIAYFTQKRFSYVKKMRVFKLFYHRNKKEIEDYFEKEGNEYVKEIAYRGSDNKWNVNMLARKALQYYIDELSENGTLIKQDSEGYIKKVLSWFYLSYNPENDLLVQKQKESVKALSNFLKENEGIPMSGVEWDIFRKELRNHYETATGETMCSGRADRIAGVQKIEEILYIYGYILEKDHKVYTLRKEAQYVSDCK